MSKVIHKDINFKPNRYYVLGLDDWEYFEILVRFLKKYYSATVISSEDNLISRRCQLMIYGKLINIEHHEDLGNFLFSYDETASKVLELICEDLENRLKFVSYD